MRLTLIALSTLALSACNNTEPSQTQLVQSGDNETTQTVESTKAELGDTKKVSEKTLEKNNIRSLNPDLGNLEITATAESIRAGYKAIHELTDDKSCDTSEQCKVLAVGSRACGGPNEYLVYSTHTTDVETVEQLAEKLTAQESQYNAISGMVSICQHLTRPATQCQQSQCVKISGSSASVY